MTGQQVHYFCVQRIRIKFIIREDMKMSDITNTGVGVFLRILSILWVIRIEIEYNEISMMFEFGEKYLRRPSIQ